MLSLLAGIAVWQVSASDLEYLRSVARDTWHCVSKMESATGLPYDNTDRGEFTSVSNIGIFLTCVVAARDFGFIDQAEQERRLDKTILAVERLKSWHGFQQSWNSVLTLKGSTSDPWVSVLDSGNLAAALIAVSQAAPHFRDRCKKLFDSMDWSFFWDKDHQALIGGFNTSTNKVNPDWRLVQVGSDAQLSLFFAVATGAAPPTLWDRLDRTKETNHGLSYFHPGWQGGGLFMQFLSAIWLDERNTELGRSSRNFAEAQIKHRPVIEAPVWGWSASDNPDGGYLGWQSIKDEVVTPHACVLPIEYFPSEAVSNLRALESLGVRSKEDGFYDAYNWKEKKRSDKFLVLDQGMLLLSLDNELNGQAIRKRFQSDAVVRYGRRLISDFSK
ncbi:MAG: glucoamylase family protein [Fimbriimonas sp.]|nr:glucoamylase family protein [Fimbriimonas sp.]